MPCHGLGPYSTSRYMKGYAAMCQGGHNHSPYTAPAMTRLPSDTMARDTRGASRGAVPAAAASAPPAMGGRAAKLMKDSKPISGVAAACSAAHALACSGARPVAPWAHPSPRRGALAVYCGKPGGLQPDAARRVSAPRARWKQPRGAAV